MDYYGMRSDSGLTAETQRRLAECNILFTTPEKMEILSRRWGTLAESSAFASRMRLLLIGAGVAARSLADEVHLLNEPRGASIETIISRLRRSLSWWVFMCSACLPCPSAVVFSVRDTR